jgi:release factor glutamine methyltransferase
MTVREASAWAAQVLSGTGSPVNDAHVLLCSLLNWKRHDLFLHAARMLSSEELAEYRSMVAMRRDRNPLQHITGSVDFMGREFVCGPEALVPRPETEVLVEIVLERIPTNPHLILDVGTGSGVIALTLAMEFPSALVVGVDISYDALSLARTNMKLHSVGNLALVSSDMLGAFEAMPGSGACVMVANLPYVPSGDLGGLQPEVLLGDPAIALDGGPDGMSHLAGFLQNSASRVRPHGIVAVEVGSGQADAAVSILSGCDDEWTGIRKSSDLCGVERVVSAVRTGGSL